MANIIIVTGNCYLICEGINYIRLSELELVSEDDDYSRKRRKRERTLPDSKRAYQILIDFIPVQTPTQAAHNRRDTESVAINVVGKKESQLLFKEMLQQIREQMPDKLFLDKLVEGFFAKT